MRTLSLKAAVALTAAFAFCACQSRGSERVTPSSTSSASSDAPQIRFTPAPDGKGSRFVDVVGLSPATLRALQQRPPADEDWPVVFRVSVGDAEVRPDLPPVAGRYSVSATAIRFEPLFPLDAGRAYRVTFDPSRLRRGGGEPIAAAAERIETTINTPVVEGRPTTRVEAVYPSGEVVPENQLRLYIFFSAPMDRARREWISLVDDAGRGIDNPFLPLDVGLWNADRTRFTVLFDPGRVKQGVMPNEQLGRSIRRGQKYTLVIDRAWRDGHGQPLVESYRRTFRVSEPIEVAIDPSTWRLGPPTKSGGIDPLVVSFPSALDYALMQRAIGVRDSRGRVVPGTISIDAHETRWRFVPDLPWEEGAYHLEIQSILEDPSGNRIGRPFELVNAAPAPIAEDSRPTLIPFRITTGSR